MQAICKIECVLNNILLPRIVMSVKLGFKANDIIAEGRVTSDDIKKIHSWLREQKNLPVISDEEIINFLLSNNNDQEKTKTTIKAYFKIRNEGADIFNNRITSDQNSASWQTFAQCGLAPKRTKDNCAVILGYMLDTSFQNFNLAEFYKMLFMTLDAAIYSNPPSGLIIVINVENFGLGHLTKLRIHALSIFFRYLQEALPVQLRNIHVLNSPSFLDKILVIIRPLMNDHVKQLLIFHKKEYSMDDFFKEYVSKEFIPEELGGELPCMKDLNEQLIKNFEDMESYFTAEENRRSLLKMLQ